MRNNTVRVSVFLWLFFVVTVSLSFGQAPSASKDFQILKKLLADSDTISVTSHGVTGSQWIRRFETGEVFVDSSAKKKLSSPDFVPTKSVTTRIVLLRAKTLGGEKLTPEVARAVEKHFGLATLTPEIACLIKQKMTDDDFAAKGLNSIIAICGKDNWFFNLRVGQFCAIDQSAFPPATSSKNAFAFCLAPNK